MFISHANQPYAMREFFLCFKLVRERERVQGGCSKLLKAAQSCSKLFKAVWKSNPSLDIFQL